MEYIIMPWLIGSLVGIYFGSNKPHLISGIFRRNIKPGIQVTAFLGMFVVCVGVMWALYDVPNPGVHEVEPLPGMLIDYIAQLGS